VTVRQARAAVAAALLLITAAVYFVFGVLHRPATTLGFDVYVYFLPIKMHLARSLAAGGSGLLWNPFQSCGEPFFANPTTGLFYPPHLLFFLLEPNAAVHAVLIVNMVIGAVGMLLLARVVGLGWAAAVAGALVFELGDPMSQLTGWSPTHNGPWAWLPWALLVCERLLRAPSRGGVVALAVVLALELFPGWVVIAALTYHVIALRVVWELITVRPRPWRSAAVIAAGLVLAPGLAAIQIVPAAELARESFRVTVEVSEFLTRGAVLANVAATIRNRVPPIPFMVGPLLLAGIAPFISPRRRLVIFYLLIGMLYGILAFGDATPLFALYAQLPPGAATFRYAHRLFWVTGFSLAMLTALAVDGLGQQRDMSRHRWYAPLIGMVLAVVLLLVVPGGLRWPEGVAVGGAVAALGAAAIRPRLGLAAAWILAAAVALSVVAIPFRYAGKLVDSIDAYWRHADAFAALDPPLTAQDRVFIASDLRSLNRFDLLQKTATILRVPDIHDYDALLGRRHVEYITMMWQGTTVNSVDDMFGKHLVTGGFRQRLLDLAAVRYVVSPPSDPVVAWGLDLPAVPTGDPGLHAFRNDRALPRARYVPHIEVVPDPSVLLNRLAYGADDLAQVAFVESPMPSGFSGAGTPPREGTARFARDDPEHVVIDVDAPAPGFLVLADQYYPGWRATVNGTAVPIHRANQMFRLVEVPAGTSRVEFRYRPSSVAVGAAISMATLAVLGIVLWPGVRRVCRNLHGKTAHAP
jgi:Bacterial membrane protein YfhO